MKLRTKGMLIAAVVAALGSGVASSASAQEYVRPGLQPGYVRTAVVVIAPGYYGNRYYDGHRYWARRDWERRHWRHRRYYGRGRGRGYGYRRY